MAYLKPIDIFATMGIKKSMALLFVALFLLARIMPALPSFKAFSKAAHQLVSKKIPLLSTSDPRTGPNQDMGDNEDDEKDNAEKGNEKDFSKSFTDYYKLSFNNTMAVIYENGSVKALFHHYRPGKVRNHVNEVFRPPLV